MTYRFENVVCTRVVDGDTIDCLIDFGFGLTQTHRFRLNRINAPETRGEERTDGLISKSWLITKIEGKQVIIESHKKGKYGRYLAEVFLPQPDVSSNPIGYMNINDQMVESGMAEYKEY